MPDTLTQLKGCPRCGLVQRVVDVPARHEARCARCRAVIFRHGAALSNRLSAATALAALVLYPLGISLPVLSIEQFGHVHETSIWAGTISLLTHGHLYVGLLVLTCSIIIPVLKVAGLLVLTRPGPWLRRHHRAGVHRALELAGRWGMIDVLLVALMVAILKLRDVVEVHPGPGVVAFTACVVLSLLATAFFNPRAIWESES